MGKKTHLKKQKTPKSPLRILLAQRLCHHTAGQSAEPRYFSVLGMSLPEKEMGAKAVMQEEDMNKKAKSV